MPHFNCSTCDQSFYRSPTGIPVNGIMNCPKCSGRSHKDYGQCQVCGKPLKTKRDKYCSTECGGIGRSVDKTPNTYCEYCNLKFYRSDYNNSRAEHHFCGYQCAAKYREKSKTGLCSVCGSSVTRTLAQTKKSDSGLMFCSREHAKAWQLNQRGINGLEKDFKSAYPIFEYVGDGQFWVHDGIGWMNPDFRIPHTKKLVELWGNYWHSGEEPQARINRLAVKGFDTLIIWESEFREHPGITFQRITDFLLDISYIVVEPSS